MIENLHDLTEFVEKEAQKRAEKIKKNKTPTKKVGAGQDEISSS